MPYVIGEVEVTNEVSLAPSAVLYDGAIVADGDLTIRVNAFNYNLDGTYDRYSGSFGNSVVDNSTNYVYINYLSVLTINTTGYPSGTELFIQLGRVVAAGGFILRIFLERAFLSTMTPSTGFVPSTRSLTAGAGLTGGGDLSANRTFDVGANADGSITVNANDIQVGVLATDAQHGSLGNGSLHTVVTTSVNGFMSSSDKTKLDGIDNNATYTPLSSSAPDDVTKAAAVIGIGTTAARADHKHDVTTAVAGAATPGDSAAEGTATSLARSDHQHDLPAYGSTSGTFCQGNDSRLSDDRTASGIRTATTIVSISTAVAPTAGQILTATSGTAADWETPNIPTNRTFTAGAGLTGGGDFSADRTFDVGANADGSITVNANDIQIGILATDAQHGSRGNGSLHTVVTTSVNGFMSSSDKTKLDGISSGAAALTSSAPADVTKATAAVGVGTAAARDDHKHDVSTATAGTATPGDSAAEGTATSLARSDHQHNLPAYGSTSGTFCQGNDSRLSDDRTASGLRTATTIVVVSAATAPTAGQVLTATSGTAATWQNTAVPSTRTLTAGAGLTGGGDLSADRTFDIGANADGSITVNADDIKVGVLATDVQHGSRGGGTQHSAVTTSVNGFMSSSDKTKLDGIASSAAALTSTAPVNVTKATAAVGTSTFAARDDHKHDVTTAAAGAATPGDSAAEGTATSLARSDHKHSLPAYGSTSGTFCQGNDSRLSDDRTASGLRSATTIVGVSAATAPTAGQVLTASSGTAASWVTPSTGVALSSSTPSAIDNTAGSAGTGTTATRSDHTHQVNIGTPVTIGTANANGSAVTLSRSDHVHSHGNQAGGALHAVVSASGPGFQPQSNPTGTVDPAAGNDNTQGYLAGSTWNNTVAVSRWVAFSVATGAAVWKKYLLAGPGTFSNGGEAGTADRTLGNTDAYALSFLTSNVPRFKINADGSIEIDPTESGTTAITVKAAASQSGDLLQFQDNTGLEQASFDYRGWFNVSHGSTPFPQAPIFISVGPANNYLQVAVQNTYVGNESSSDFVATADNGDNSTYYVDLGINGSTYSDSAYTIMGASDSYLVNYNGNLIITTGTTSNTIKFGTGGTLTANLRMTLTDTGLVMNSLPISNVSDPVNAQDVATKNYVDSAGGTHPACRVATTGNITLSGTQTIDGIPVVAGDRVLCKDQTTQADRGIYVCAAGAWSRATDFSTSAQANIGCIVYVRTGTLNGNTHWSLTTQPTITLGSTSLSFSVVELDSTAPANVTKASASAGASNYLARVDHKHDVSTAAAVATTVGGSNAEGTATTLARSDHTHSLPAFGTTAGTFAQGNDSRLSDDRTASGLRSATTIVVVSAATAPTNGQVLTASSGTAASWITPSAGLQLTTNAPANVTKATAAVGVGTAAARDDHKHDITTAAAVTLSVGGSNAEGVATSIARSDHTHALPAFGTTSGTFCQGNDSRLSDARTPTAHASTHLPGGTDALTTAAPVDVGTANTAGSAASFSRSDHVHNTPFSAVNTALGSANATISVNGQRITGLYASNPGSTSDAASVAYVTGWIRIKYPANLVSTANITTLSGAGSTIDSVTVTNGMIVLLTGQSTATQNGLWTVNSSAWTRPSYFAAGGMGYSASGVLVSVIQGTLHQDSLWLCDSLSGSDVVDTNNLSFVKIGHPLSSTTPATEVVGGSGAVGTGNTSARADHIHPMPAFGTTSGTFCQGNDSRLSDARAPTAHASTHLPGGTDALTTAAPVDTGTANAAGSAASFSRSDHVHNTSFAGVKSALGAASSSVSFNTQQITGVVDPTTAQMAATKNYVDNQFLLTDIKPSVSAVASYNITTLSGTVIVDAVSLTDGMRLLLYGQTTQTQNGIWIVHTGAWTRAPDMDVGSDASGAVVFVEQGLGNAGTGWVLYNAPGTAIVGTNNIGFQPISGKAVALVNASTTVVINLGGPPTSGQVLTASSSTVAGWATLPAGLQLTSTAPVNVTKATAAVGTSTFAARDDHKHDVTTAAAVALTVGGSNAEGSATTIARSDHTHSLPAFGTTSGTFAQGNDSRLSDDRTAAGLRTATTVVSVSAATAPSSGQALVATSSTTATWQSVATLTANTPAAISLSAGAVGVGTAAARDDHVHLANTAAPATGAVAIGNTAVVGSATTLARSDHTHTVTDGTPVAVGTANANGSATTFSRSDHVHNHGSQTVGTLHAAVSNTTNGFASAVGASGTVAMSNGTAMVWNAQSSITHANLGSLTADDHTQYLLVSGTRAMTGTLNLNNQDLDNPKTITFNGLIANGNSGTAFTVNWTLGQKQSLVLTGACTLTFTAPIGVGNFILELKQDGTGSRTVTWPSSVRWPGGVVPVLTTTLNKTDLISFFYDGTYYLGVATKNYTLA